MAADPVLLSVDAASGVATVTLNRPESLNALDAAMTEGLRETFSAIAARTDIRAVLLTGTGDHFMAGGDIRVFAEFNTRPREERPDLARPLIAGVGQAITTIRTMPQPVVARVHGACAGFGLSLANACDMTIASDDAYFTLAYINIGTSPDGSGSFFLPRLVGPKRAAEIALLGGRFDAATAERWGMVNAVHARADLEAEAAKIAGRLAALPAGAMARTKALLNQALDNDLAAQLTAEENSFSACTATGDWEEGIDAFLTRRKPAFNQGS
jgi:2-(1,2-epoxy-1,2-dihydrophenyl)acetyl-CoA isomerase